MSLISVSVRLDRVNESLLYESKSDTFYLNLLLLPEKDRFGNYTVIQPVGREAYANGERGEPCGTWKELTTKSDSPKHANLDFSKFKRPQAKTRDEDPGPSHQSKDQSDRATQQSPDDDFESRIPL